MRYLLAVTFWALVMYVTVPPIVRFVRDWRSLHFAMSRVGNPLSNQPRSLWLESLKRMNASDRHRDLENVIGMVGAIAIYGIGYMLAGVGGAVIACVMAVAIVFWRVR